MKTTLDQNGRIELPDSVRAQLGVEPGDQVLLENHNGQWVLMAADRPAGLCWHGDVLVHEGVSLQPADEVLNQVREERAEHLREGLAR